MWPTKSSIHWTIRQQQLMTLATTCLRMVARVNSRDSSQNASLRAVTTAVCRRTVEFQSAVSFWPGLFNWNGVYWSSLSLLGSIKGFTLWSCEASSNELLLGRLFAWHELDWNDAKERMNDFRITPSLTIRLYSLKQSATILPKKSIGSPQSSLTALFLETMTLVTKSWPMLISRLPQSNSLLFWIHTYAVGRLSFCILIS
jgi:hypothetical protein